MKRGFPESRLRESPPGLGGFPESRLRESSPGLGGFSESRLKESPPGLGGGVLSQDSGNPLQVLLEICLVEGLTCMT